MCSLQDTLYYRLVTKLETEYRRRKCWGMVASVDVYGCSPRAVRDPRKIKRFIVALCREIKMKRYGEALIERFAEGALEGYSAMQFIETSSVTMHFDEGENRAFIDIFSCRFFDPKKAEVFCRNFLGGQKSKILHYFRK